MLKFRLLPLVLEVVRKSGTVQEYRRNRSASAARTACERRRRGSTGAWLQSSDKETAKQIREVLLLLLEGEFNGPCCRVFAQPGPQADVEVAVIERRSRVRLSLNFNRHALDNTDVAHDSGPDHEAGLCCVGFVRWSRLSEQNFRVGAVSAFVIFFGGPQHRVGRLNRR